MLSLCLLLCSVCSSTLVDLALVVDRVDVTRIATVAKTIAMGEVVMAKKLPRWMFM